MQGMNIERESRKMFGRKGQIKKAKAGKAGEKQTYDRENQKPVLKCSICNGEQVAGFKDIHTGRFQEVMLIRDDRELEAFMEMYDISEISKEY